jgi:hypothetical protein
MSLAHLIKRLILLYTASVIGIEMRHNLNKKNNNRYVITAATLFTLAIMTATASIMATAPAAATTTTEAITTTTAQAASPSGIHLSPEPVYQERQVNLGETPINQTHVQLTTSGNGTLTLPNTTETISTSSTGSIIASLAGTAAGKEVITTEDGSESATATFYGIARFGEEEGRGIIIALIDTNSTGRLAPLDGMILAGQIEFPPEEATTSFITLWEWESGIPLPIGTNTNATTTTEELPPQVDDTTATTTTNATPTADTGEPIAAIPEE